MAGSFALIGFGVLAIDLLNTLSWLCIMPHRFIRHNGKNLLVVFPILLSKDDRDERNTST